MILAHNWFLNRWLGSANSHNTTRMSDTNRYREPQYTRTRLTIALAQLHTPGLFDGNRFSTEGVTAIRETLETQYVLFFWHLSQTIRVSISFEHSTQTKYMVLRWLRTMARATFCCTRGSEAVVLMTGSTAFVRISIYALVSILFLFRDFPRSRFTKFAGDFCKLVMWNRIKIIFLGCSKSHRPITEAKNIYHFSISIFSTWLIHGLREFRSKASLYWTTPNQQICWRRHNVIACSGGILYFEKTWDEIFFFLTRPPSV